MTGLVTNLAGTRTKAVGKGLGIVGTKPMRRRTPPLKKPAPGTAGPRSAGLYQREMDAYGKHLIETALKKTGGNVVHAGRALGLSQPSMYGRMAAFGIDPQRYRRS